MRVPNNRAAGLVEPARPLFVQRSMPRHAADRLLEHHKRSSLALAFSLVLPLAACACRSDPPTRQAQASSDRDPAWSKTLVLLSMGDLIPMNRQTAVFTVRIDGREVWKGTLSSDAPHPSPVRIELSEPLPSLGTIDIKVQVDSSTYTTSAPANEDGFLEVRARLHDIYAARTSTITGYC